MFQNHFSNELTELTFKIPISLFNEVHSIYTCFFNVAIKQTNKQKLSLAIFLKVFM